MENKMEDFKLTKKPDTSIFDRRFPISLESDPIHDPTKMTIIQGTDGVLDDLFSYQVYNKLKNHWRLGVEPADKQAGMIWSDLDDNKLYHYGAAWEEILQLTRSNDVSPQFATVRLMDTGADHYLDLKCNEDLGAHRLLNIIVGDVARTITLSGSPTLGDWFNQSVKTTAAPGFATGVTIGNLTLGNGSITDSSGAISFGNENLTTTGKVTIGSATPVLGNMFQVRSDADGVYAASIENDFAGGWGLHVDVDGSASADIVFRCRSGSTNRFTVFSDGDLEFATQTSGNSANLYHFSGDEKQMYRFSCSQRYKEKVTDLELDSSKLHNIRPVSYDSLCEPDVGKGRFHGLIAEEIEQYYPEIVVYNENNEAESYDTQMLMTLILTEVQKHEIEIKALKAQLNN